MRSFIIQLCLLGSVLAAPIASVTEDQGHVVPRIDDQTLPSTTVSNTDGIQDETTKHLTARMPPKANISRTRDKNYLKPLKKKQNEKEEAAKARADAEEIATRAKEDEERKRGRQQELDGMPAHKAKQEKFVDSI